MLQRETRLGLTFGQIISILTILGSVLLAWVSINVRIAQAEVRIEELEKGRVINSQNIEKIRVENREDHQRILDKLDDVQNELKK